MTTLKSRQLLVASAYPLLVDVLHLPSVERFQFGILALSSEGHADAVFTAGVNALSDALATAERSLKEKEVTKLRRRIIRTVENTVGAKLRG